MRREQMKLIEALERVEGFLETNRKRMERVITSNAHQNFSASRERMREYMTAQDEHSRGIRTTVARKRRLADRLIRAHLRPIALVARMRLPTAGEFAALQAVPDGRRALITLVGAAHGMARAAKLHERELVEAGLPTDFIQQLEAATEALNDGITAKGETESLRVRATSGLHLEARAARYALRLLDMQVRVAFEGDDVLLAEWGSVSHIAAVAVSSQASTELVEIPPPESLAAA